MEPRERPLTTSRNPLACLALLLAASGLWSCGLIDGGTYPQGCERGAQLSADRGKPASRVMVTGFPGVGTPYAIVAVDEVPMSIALIDGDALIVPTHPKGIQGGRLTLQVTDNVVTCPPIAFQIEPIAAAPGSLETFRSHAWAIAAKMARLEGFDVESLLQEPGLPRSMIPVAAAAAALSQAPSLSPAELEIVEAVLADSGALEAAAAFQEAVPDLGGRSLRAIGTQRRALSACESIETVQELQDALERRGQVNVANTAYRPIIDVAADASISVGMYFPQAGAVIGGVAFGLQNAFDGTRKMLPSQLLNLTFEADRLNFEHEDSTQIGKVSNVRVDASSEGWDITKSAVDLALMKTGGKLLKPLDRVESGYAEYTELLINNGSAICGNVQACSEPGDLVLEPCYWSGFELEAEHWFQTEVRAAPDESVRLIDKTQYVAFDDGAGKLEVSTDPNELKADSARADKTITVPKIEIELTPSEIRNAEIGQRYAFTASVQSAQMSNLSWTLESDGQVLDALTDDGGLHTFGFTVPEINWRAGECERVLRVGAEALTRTGARANATDAREGSALIVVNRPEDDPERQCGELQISPKETCIGTNAEARFFAALSGLDDDRVRWSTTTGTITGEGVLTAGAEEGEFIVSVRSVAAPALVAESRVSVGNCVCRWSFGGGASASGNTVLISEDPVGADYSVPVRLVNFNSDLSAVAAYIPDTFFAASSSQVIRCGVEGGVAALQVGNHRFVCKEGSAMGVTIDPRGEGQFAGHLTGVGDFSSRAGEFSSGFALDFVGQIKPPGPVSVCN